MLCNDVPRCPGMPRPESIDHETRERLRAWLRYFYDRKRLSQEEFGKELGDVGQGTVSQILSGRKTMGLDVLLKMSRKFRRSLDELVDDWPPGSATTKEENTTPSTASPASHAPRRRELGGGPNGET